MSREEIELTVRLPPALVQKLDQIAKFKYVHRNDVIIDACAYYCQFHDMNSEKMPETMRNVLFDLARHDGEFRQTLRDVLKENPLENQDR
ncbi:MAG: hypothetical protein GYA23_13895 [Methanomicrobiales archaeon]|nr:hypothetical protein [Methanomicrobiales archaeon]